MKNRILVPCAVFLISACGTNSGGTAGTQSQQVVSSVKKKRKCEQTIKMLVINPTQVTEQEFISQFGGTVTEERLADGGIRKTYETRSESWSYRGFDPKVRKLISNRRSSSTATTVTRESPLPNGRTRISTVGEEIQTWDDDSTLSRSDSYKSESVVYSSGNIMYTESASHNGEDDPYAKYYLRQTTQQGDVEVVKNWISQEFTEMDKNDPSSGITYKTYDSVCLYTLN
ncbi:MAG: hypothetical protein JNL01_10705 [Bdellovibrionales bacterium]|nr:hypothetical protein [Bdellovibrionales bacterium]